jgi:hypothetical protein
MRLRPCEDWYLLKPTIGITLMLATGPSQNMQPKFKCTTVPHARESVVTSHCPVLVLRLRNNMNFSVSAVVERGGLSFSIHMR